MHSYPRAVELISKIQGDFSLTGACAPALWLRPIADIMTLLDSLAIILPGGEQHGGFVAPKGPGARPYHVGMASLC